MNYEGTNYNKARCLEAIVRDKQAKHRKEALELLGKMKDGAVPILERIANDPNVETTLKSKAEKILKNLSQAEISATTCPECNFKMIPQNGCFFCQNCGFSKCG